MTTDNKQSLRLWLFGIPSTRLSPVQICLTVVFTLIAILLNNGDNHRALILGKLHHSSTTSTTSTTSSDNNNNFSCSMFTSCFSCLNAQHQLSSNTDATSDSEAASRTTGYPYDDDNNGAGGGDVNNDWQQRNYEQQQTSASGVCSWCAMSSKCINSTVESCVDWPVAYVGSLGLKSTFARLTERDETVVNNCASRIDHVDQCVVGSEFAQIYLPYSTSVRNSVEGGFDDQPTLPVPSEFIQAYVNELIDDSSKLVSQLKRYNMTAHVGSYVMIDESYWSTNHSDIHNNNGTRRRRRYEPISYTPSSLLGIRTLRANYSLDPNNGQLIVKPNDKSNQVLYHILLTSTGMIATSGSYRIGYVFLVHNDSSRHNPTCLFYTSPKKIEVYMSTKDVFLGPYLYLGVPLFILSHLTLLLFAKCCPWSNTKYLANSLRDQKQQQLETDYMNSQKDTAVANEENCDDCGDHALDSYVLQGRVEYSIRWFLSMNSVKVVQQCGFQAYYHWKFYRRCIFLIFVVGVLVICALVPIHVTQHFKDSQHLYADFAITTAATLRKGSTLAVVHYLLSIVIYLITVINMVLVLKLIFFKKSHTRQSLFTAHLTNLPDLVLKVVKTPEGDITIENSSEVKRREKQLKCHYDAVIKEEHEIRYAKSKYEGKTIPPLDAENVLSVNVIADIGHLIPYIDSLHTIETQLKDRSVTDEQLIRRRIERLNETREKLFQMASKKPIVSNSAFVTFRSVQGLRSCVKLHERKEAFCTEHSLKFCDDPALWRLSETTWEPEEILWENICVSTTSTAIRVIVVYIVFFIVFFLMFLAVITFVITGGTYNLAIGLHLTHSIAKIRNSHNKFVMGIVKAMTWLAGRLPLVVAILVEITSAITYNITRIEKMKTIARYQASTLLKTLCIMAMLACWLPYVEDRALLSVSKYVYYNSTVIKLTQFILAQLFVSRSFKHIGKIFQVIVSYIVTKGEPQRLEFDFITSYSKAIVIFFIVLTSCTKMPLLVIPGLIFMLVSYVADSFLLAFFYEKSNVTGTLEIAVLSILMVYSAVSSVIAAPQINVTVRAILSSSFAGVTLTVTTLLVAVFMFIKWAARRKHKVLLMKNEDIFVNNYAQPHLQMLIRDEPFKPQVCASPKLSPKIAFEVDSPRSDDPMVVRI